MLPCSYQLEYTAHASITVHLSRTHEIPIIRARPPVMALMVASPDLHEKSTLEAVPEESIHCPIRIHVPQYRVTVYAPVYQALKRMAQPRESPQIVQPAAFVETYDPPTDVDSWTFTHRFREARAMVDSHEDVSLSHISAQVDLPASSLAKWFFDDEEMAPSLIEDLETAKKMGWIAMSPHSTVFRGFNVLVGSVFALGTIDATTYEPRFAVRSPRDIDRVAWAITHIGVKYRMARDSEHERARALIPRKYGTIIGRVLVTMGAPTNDDDVAEGGLPSYLFRVSKEHQLAFAKTFVESHPRVVSANEAIRIQESRTSDFLDDLTRFLEDVSGGTVTRQEQDIVVSADAAMALGNVVS